MTDTMPTLARVQLLCSLQRVPADYRKPDYGDGPRATLFELTVHPVIRADKASGKLPDDWEETVRDLLYTQAYEGNFEVAVVVELPHAEGEPAKYEYSKVACIPYPADFVPPELEKALGARVEKLLMRPKAGEELSIDADDNSGPLAELFAGLSSAPSPIPSALRFVFVMALYDDEERWTRLWAAPMLRRHYDAGDYVRAPIDPTPTMPPDEEWEYYDVSKAPAPRAPLYARCAPVRARALADDEWVNDLEHFDPDAFLFRYPVVDGTADVGVHGSDWTHDVEADLYTLFDLPQRLADMVREFGRAGDPPLTSQVVLAWRRLALASTRDLAGLGIALGSKPPSAGKCKEATPDDPDLNEPDLVNAVLSAVAPTGAWTAEHWCLFRAALRDWESYTLGGDDANAALQRWAELLSEVVPEIAELTKRHGESGLDSEWTWQREADELEKLRAALLDASNLRRVVVAQWDRAVDASKNVELRSRWSLRRAEAVEFLGTIDVARALGADLTRVPWTDAVRALPVNDVPSDPLAKLPETIGVELNAYALHRASKGSGWLPEAPGGLGGMKDSVETELKTHAKRFVLQRHRGATGAAAPGRFRPTEQPLPVVLPILPLRHVGESEGADAQKLLQRLRGVVVLARELPNAKAANKKSSWRCLNVAGVSFGDGSAGLGKPPKDEDLLLGEAFVANRPIYRSDVRRAVCEYRSSPAVARDPRADINDTAGRALEPLIVGPQRKSSDRPELSFRYSLPRGSDKKGIPQPSSYLPLPMLKPGRSYEFAIAGVTNSGVLAPTLTGFRFTKPTGDLVAVDQPAAYPGIAVPAERLISHPMIPLDANSLAEVSIPNNFVRHHDERRTCGIGLPRCESLGTAKWGELDPRSSLPRIPDDVFPLARELGLSAEAVVLRGASDELAYFIQPDGTGALAPADGRVALVVPKFSLAGLLIDVSNDPKASAEAKVGFRWTSRDGAALVIPEAWVRFRRKLRESNGATGEIVVDVSGASPREVELPYSAFRPDVELRLSLEPDRATSSVIFFVEVRLSDGRWIHLTAEPIALGDQYRANTFLFAAHALAKADAFSPVVEFGTPTPVAAPAHDDETGRSPVLLLADAKDSKRVPSKWSLHLRRPSVGIEVWEPWISTQTYEAPNSVINALELLRRIVRKEESLSRDPKAPRVDRTIDDPAVDGLLVEWIRVPIDPRAQRTLEARWFVQPKAWKDGPIQSKVSKAGIDERVQAEAYPLSIECHADIARTTNFGADGGTVVIRPGEVYELRVSCAVKLEDRGDDGRFARRFEQGARFYAPDGAQPEPKAPPTHALFGAYRVLVEGAWLEPFDFAVPFWRALSTRFRGDAVELVLDRVAFDGGASARKKPTRDFVHRVEVRRQVWRWDGRPTQWGADARELEFPSHGIDALDPQVVAGASAIDGHVVPTDAMKWELTSFADRSEYDFTERTKVLSRWSEGAEVDEVLMRDDLARDPLARYVRYRVVGVSRYAGLRNSLRVEAAVPIQWPGDKTSTAVEPWKRAFVPFRRRDPLLAPSVRIALPLTESADGARASEDPLRPVPPLLVVLNETWFEQCGLVESLTAECIELVSDPMRAARDGALPETPNLEVVGPVGYTHDLAAGTARFSTCSFLVTPVFKDAPSPLRWPFARIRLRRSVDPRSLATSTASSVQSIAVDLPWVQWGRSVDDLDAWNLVAGQRLVWNAADTCFDVRDPVLGGDVLAMKNLRATDIQSNRLQRCIAFAITELICDAGGKEAERFVGLYEPDPADLANALTRGVSKLRPIGDTLRRTVPAALGPWLRLRVLEFEARADKARVEDAALLVGKVGAVQATSGITDGADLGEALFRRQDPTAVVPDDAKLRLVRVSRFRTIENIH